MKAIRILLSIAMLIAAGLGAFNVIPLRTAYFTLIILVAITVSIRIIHRTPATAPQIPSSGSSARSSRPSVSSASHSLLTARSDRFTRYNRRLENQNPCLRLFYIRSLFPISNIISIKFHCYLPSLHHLLDRLAEFRYSGLLVSVLDIFHHAGFDVVG